jgi:tetratricopeptide (TPR) repeat protein
MHTRALPLLSASLAALATIAPAALMGRISAAAAPSATVTFTEATQPTQGQPVTAIGMKTAGGDAAGPAQVLVLVDTSASQTGEFRRRALDAVAGLLEAARPDDRFAIAAVDVNCTPLAKDFQPARSPAVTQATRALDARTPLGATDLVGALAAAADFFAATPADGPRAIVYVGDGPGLTGIDPAEFSQAIDALRTKRIAVSSLGIGPQINWPCLAAVANATGGMLLVPEEKDAAKEAGARIGAAAVHDVAWPDEVALSSDVADAALRLLPGRLPPLRSDRDAVVLVEGPLAKARLEMRLNRGADQGTVTLDLPAAKPQEQNAYLGELARNARDTDGVFLPLLGREGLALARSVVLGEAAQLAALSRQAEAAGSHDSALRLAEASLRRDPDNADAAVVREVVQRRAGPVPPPPQPGVGVITPPEQLPAADENELAELNAMRKVRAQQLEQETAVRLRNARQLLTTDPDLARQQLKEAQEMVRTDDALDPETRDRLTRQLEMRIRESIVRSREKTDRDLAAERRTTIGRARAELVADLDRREAKIKALTERYNALVQEGIRVGYQRPTSAFVEAEREVGLEIAEEAPPLYANYPVPMTARVVGETAPLVARMLDYHAENTRVRRDQERGFMDVMHLIDVAGIPFPDEPPIIYPSAARWKQITEDRKKYKSVDLANPGSAEQKIYDALDGTVQNLNFTETPLRDVIAQLKDSQGIPIQLDMKALEDAGIDLDTPVTKDLSGISLRSALRLLLGDIDLTYLIKDEVLLITTKEKAGENLVIKVYPVADLVLPVNPSSGLNPFQSGGGLGGANSINSGMNAGGGGMGMGGGMGGGGMGGFCWVAREVYGVHDPRWLVFRAWLTTDGPTWLRSLYAAQGPAFADWIHDKPLAKAAVRAAMDLVVEPRLIAQGGGQFQVSDARERIARKDKPDTVPAVPTTPETAPPTTPRQGLPATVLDAADLRQALGDYLGITSEGDAGRERQRRFAQLRASAAALGAAGEFGRAADLIAATLACGHVEPWMYESLAIAMEAAGRPREDVERVLLSSADLAVSPTDLLGLANYLARFGSDTQAIRICRQITRLDPTSREAYALAMTLAARNEDAATLAWACPGVLAHEWPAGQQEIALRAGRLAKATITALQKAGKADQAAAFKAAADQALVRDVVVELSWTGDADVDVLVEEPSGSVCSAAAPRSSAGGVLLGDEAEQVGNDTATHRERYVAAQAFPGTYRVLVRRAWGKVAADTVTAKVILRKGTKNEESLTRSLRLGGDQQTFAFAVPDGRRREPLLDAQIAQDVVAQQEIGKAILAQQIQALADPAVAASMSASRGGVAGAPGTGFPPFFGPNAAVGYQPVITTLPEGVNMFARAVVSADRRYVRITCTPLFSGVGNVTTFNFQTGGVSTAPSSSPAAQGGVAGGAGAGAAAGVGGAADVGGGAGPPAAAPGVCWVAREAFGADDPRWQVFRSWLVTSAPRSLRDVYIAHGPAFAEWIHDKPAVKAGVRFLMVHVIEAHVSAIRSAAPATKPCRGSE